MKKNGHYRRVLWLTENERNLGQIVENCLQQRETETLPRFPMGDGLECVIVRQTLAAERRYLHFIVFEAGAPVAIVNTEAELAAAGGFASEQDPHSGQEFIQSQLFCLISDNHIVWTTHNSPLRENSLQLIFSSLIDSCGFGGTTGNTQFGFQVVLDDEVVLEAFRSGIQEIDLGLGAFRPTLERIINGGELPEDGILSKIGSFFSHRPTAEEIVAADHIEGKLVLRPGRDWDKPHVLDLLANMSEGIRSDYDDDFVIVTKNGVRLTREKMSLQREFEVEGNKRVLTSIQVDEELRAIFNNMIEDNTLDV